MLDLEVTITMEAEFHIGSGFGVGRTIDAGIVKDEDGLAVIPASTIKGLARAAAAELFPEKGDADPRVTQIFGSRGRNGDRSGAVIFRDARSIRASVPAKRTTQITGRSSRDRITGRALKGHLFHFEDAETGQFRCRLTSRQPLSDVAVALLILALRRIRAIGGQRRRGKGQAKVTVRVVEGPFKGLQVPAPNGTPIVVRHGEFERALSAVLQQPGDVPETTSDANDARSRTVPEAASQAGTAAATPAAWTSRVVVAFAVSNLAVAGSPEAGHVVHSLAYVPGTSVRGAIAARLLAKGVGTDAGSEFESVFAREAVVFGPLYPLSHPEVEQSAPFPMPQHLHTCKLYPGVGRNPGAVNVPHGVTDLRTGHDTCGWAPDVSDAPGERETQVPCLCGETLQPLSGFASLLNGTFGGQEISACTPSMRIIQRTAIDSDTQRGKDGELYATEVIERGTWFAGHMHGPAQLVDFIEMQLGTSFEAHVGRAISRGHGGLRLTLLSHAAVAPSSEAASASDSPYPGLVSRAITTDDLKGESFTVTLYSDLIACDDMLRPLTTLSADEFWSLIGGKGPAQFSINSAFSSPRTISGFNGVPRVPRTDDVAIVAGSMFEFRLSPDADRAAVAKLLVTAEERGIGFRRGEGFGRIVVNLLGQEAVSHGQLASPRFATLIPGAAFTACAEVSSRSASCDPTADGESFTDEMTASERSGLARLLLLAAQRGATWRKTVTEALEGRKEPRADRQRPLDKLLASISGWNCGDAEAAERLRATASDLARGDKS